MSIVNPKAVGQNVATIVLIGLQRDRADIIDNFKQTIRSTLQFMAAY